MGRNLRVQPPVSRESSSAKCSGQYRVIDANQEVQQLSGAYEHVTTWQTSSQKQGVGFSACGPVHITAAGHFTDRTHSGPVADEKDREGRLQFRLRFLRDTTWHGSPATWQCAMERDYC